MLQRYLLNLCADLVLHTSKLVTSLNLLVNKFLRTVLSAKGMFLTLLDAEC